MVLGAGSLKPGGRPNTDLLLHIHVAILHPPCRRGAHGGLTGFQLSCLPYTVVTLRMGCFWIAPTSLKVKKAQGSEAAGSLCHRGCVDVV